MAEAEAQAADTVMTQGTTQSDHARQTAAFVAKIGMSRHLLLEDRTGGSAALFGHSAAFDFSDRRVAAAE